MLDGKSTGSDDFFHEWWKSTDLLLLFTFFALLLMGGVASLSYSPAAVSRIHGLSDPYHFVVRQVAFVCSGVAIMILVSFLSPAKVILLSGVLLALSISGVLVTLAVGDEIKGAQRWLSLGSFGVQPSEFLKPSFVVIAALLLSGARRGKPLPLLSLFVVLTAIVMMPLLLQPDIGQMLLIFCAAVALVFLAGLRLAVLIVLVPVLTLLAWLIAASFGHVSARLASFFGGDAIVSYQIGKSLEAIVAGGWLGVGSAEGVVKWQLPDGHSDFVLAIVAEEYGAVAVLMIVLVFSCMVGRAVFLAARNEVLFVRYATTALAFLLGFQAFVNFGVTIGLLPATGMTFPFVSYGGSSLWSACYSFGIVIALLRAKPSGKELIEALPLAGGRAK